METIDTDVVELENKFTRLFITGTTSVSEFMTLIPCSLSGFIDPAFSNLLDIEEVVGILKQKGVDVWGGLRVLQCAVKEKVGIDCSTATGHVINSADEAILQEMASWIEIVVINLNDGDWRYQGDVVFCFVFRKKVI
jgi:hypothetical protein